MRQSQQFSKTLKDAPSGETSSNAALLLRGGFVDKTMSGVYTFLPLGLLVLKKIESIIRDEMNALGAQELLMPALQPREAWEATGRWDTFDALYRVRSSDGSHEFGLGPTHEEIITPLAKKFISSYRDLPTAVYQIQTKFRFEPRAKSGILRGREFIMKDLYSFHLTETDLLGYYDRVAAAYEKIFSRIGITAIKTRASGGAFSEFSHEYQVVTNAGEDTIFHCACGFSENKEIAKVAANDPCPQCGHKISESKAIEVGNIFPLYRKFSDAFDLKVVGESGKSLPVFMGCFGLGITRIMGAVAEVFHDDRGILWPVSVAPFYVHLILFGSDRSAVQMAEDIYEQLRVKGVEVLFDDRTDTSAGVKFADADLIGCPIRVVVSAKTAAAASVEIKKRNETTPTVLLANEFVDRLYV